MRLYHDTSFRYCVSCGGTEPACQAAQERGLIACCPNCDHGVPVVSVPWCETHDAPMPDDWPHCGQWRTRKNPCVWRDDLVFRIGGNE